MAVKIGDPLFGAFGEYFSLKNLTIVLLHLMGLYSLKPLKLEVILIETRMAGCCASSTECYDLQCKHLKKKQFSGVAGFF